MLNYITFLLPSPIFALVQVPVMEGAPTQVHGSVLLFSFTLEYIFLHGVSQASSPVLENKTDQSVPHPLGCSVATSSSPPLSPHPEGSFTSFLPHHMKHPQPGDSEEQLGGPLPVSGLL